MFSVTRKYIFQFGGIAPFKGYTAFSCLVDYEIVDSAIYDDWEEFINNKLVNCNNLINLVEKFINEYANDF